MNCLECNLEAGKEIKGFNSEDSFIKHKNNLSKLVAENKMEIIEAPNDGGPFERKYYKCNACGQVWQLEFPDQSFRGGYKEIETL